MRTRRYGIVGAWLRAWPVLLGAVVLSCDSPTGINPADYPRNAADAQFVVDDVRRFWAAYDAGGRDGNATAFQKRYLDSATAGLRNFASARTVTAQSLVDVVHVYRAYYDALRPVSLAITTSDPVFTEVRANYARIQQLYPDAFFPPVTLLFGRFNTGGTTGSAGMLIGMEFYGVDANAPLGGLSTFARDNQFSLRNDFAPLVAHEHAHMLQQAAGATGLGNGGTLLSRALAEGGADFIGELSSGRPSYRRKFAEWQAREREFWTAFARDMQGTDVSRWLYNQGSGTTEWPGDLGYFMGYRIAQAFYSRATDKAAALRELIAQRDPASILERGGYAGNGPPILVPER